MKKLFLFIFFILTLTSCASKQEEYPTIQDKLSNMQSYKTDAEITYISNKGNTTYNATIYAKNDERYRIEVNSPEDYRGNIIMYDGKLVWQYNPHLQDNKISANPPDKASRREIILFSFLKNYAKSMETTVATANVDKAKTTVLEAKLPSSTKLLNSEKLFVDNETMLPVKLVIYDSDNNEKIVVNFSNFEYNQKIEDDVFKLQKTTD